MRFAPLLLALACLCLLAGMAAAHDDEYSADENHNGYLEVYRSQLPRRLAPLQGCRQPKATQPRPKRATNQDGMEQGKSRALDSQSRDGG